jgi:hypothetical protein
MACQAVANIVKSSLGPVGLDKVFGLHIDLLCVSACVPYVARETGGWVLYVCKLYDPHLRMAFLTVRDIMSAPLTGSSPANLVTSVIVRCTSALNNAMVCDVLLCRNQDWRS